MPKQKNLEQSATLFGEKVQEAMDKKGLDIRGLSDALGSTYEYVRRITRGTALPSKYMLRAICQELKLNFPEMEKLLVSDKIRKTHGTIPLELSGKNPELEPWERGWPHLTSQQKEILNTQFKTFLAQNRKHRAG